MPDHAEVVGDQHVGEAERLLQVGEEVEDLGLDRDVERRDRLVGYYQSWLQCDRPSNPDPLALAARQLVGIPLSLLGRQAHQLQQLGHPSSHGFAVAVVMHPQHVADNAADPLAGVERAVWVLEHDLHLAAQAEQLTTGDLVHIQAAYPHRPGGGGLERQDAPPEGGFAAARLPHQCECLAVLDRERDAVERVHHLFLATHARRPGGIVHNQILDFDQRSHDTGSNVSDRSRTRSVSGSQQAARWPGRPCSVSGGRWSHWSKRWRQRGANGQPGRGSTRRGG